MENKVITWSGGMDSTLLLYKVLLERENKPVHVFGFNLHDIDELKQLCEFDCRAIIRKKILKTFKDVYFNEVYSKTVRYHNEGYLCGHSKNALYQPLAWISMIFLNIPDNSELMFGYIKDDCFWDKQGDFEQAIYAMARVSGRKIKISYPLKDYSKQQIMKELDGLSLMDHVWQCESPRKYFIPCETCGSCERIFKKDDLRKSEDKPTLSGR